MVKLDYLKRVSIFWAVFYIFSIIYLSYNIYSLFDLGNIKVLDLRRISNEEIFFKLKIGSSSKIFVEGKEYVRDDHGEIWDTLDIKDRDYIELDLQNDVGFHRSKNLKIISK